MKLEPIKYYLNALSNFGKLNGRSRRKELWYFVGINVLILLFLFLIRLLILEHNNKIIIDAIIATFCLLMFTPTISVTIRRLHDTGRPGSFIFFNLIPIIGTITFTIYMLADSTMGYNRYGEYPKFAPIHWD